MSYTLSIAQAAEIDIREAFLWYEEKQDNLGTRFEQDII